MTFFHWVIAAVVSHSAAAGLGAFAWSKYKAKVAADLASVAKKV